MLGPLKLAPSDLLDLISQNPSLATVEIVQVVLPMKYWSDGLPSSSKWRVSLLWHLNFAISF